MSFRIASTLVLLAFAGGCATTQQPPPPSFAQCPEPPIPPPGVPLEPLDGVYVSPVPTSESEAFVEVAGNCGLRKDGTVACWDHATHLPPPDARFKQITPLPGGTMFCGVTTAGPLLIWPPMMRCDSRLRVIDGTFSKFVWSLMASCALRDDGALHCFAGGFCDQGPPPGARFRQVHTFNSSGCGILKDGGVTCWGLNAPEGLPSAGIKRIYSFGERACGLRQDGTVECWVPKAMPWFSCGDAMMHAQATERVEGGGISGATLVSGGHGALGAVGGITDGLRANFAAQAAKMNEENRKGFEARFAAWPERRKALLVPPPGAYKELGAGTGEGCGLRTDGTLYRWNLHAGKPIASMPGRYVRMDAMCGPCALRADGRVACPNKPAPPTQAARISELPAAGDTGARMAEDLKAGDAAIREGSTKADVERALGKASSVAFAAGFEVWTYVKIKPGGAVEVVVVKFDKDGRVAEHAFSGR